MSHKPQQRRGLGRGLGSLIPTAPQPEPEPSTGSVAVEEHDRPEPGHDSAPTTQSADPARVAGPGSADWIGVPLPGDPPATDGNTAGQEPAGVTDEPVGTAQEGPPRTEVAETTATPGTSASVDAPADAHLGAAADAPDVDAWEHDGRAVSGGSGGAEGSVDGDAALRPVAGAYFAELPVGTITPNPRQPREVFDEEAMAELVHSIEEVGLLQPIVVRAAADGAFELVMGERRWRAAQQAGLDAIPAIVRETGDDDLLRDALLENLHRAELNALEEAAAYQQLLEDFGCTHEELATRIGRSRPQISNTIRLLKLSPAVQRRVAAGVLSAGHARALLAVDDAAVQDRLAGRVVAEGISVRGLEEIVAVGDLGTGVPTVRRSRPTAPGVDDLAARLSDRLETRVRVDLGKRKGRITVEFASLPDLERIIGLIDPGHPTRTRQDGTSQQV